jgi:hypothetical protein
MADGNARKRRDHSIDAEGPSPKRRETDMSYRYFVGYFSSTPYTYEPVTPINEAPEAAKRFSGN